MHFKYGLICAILLTHIACSPSLPAPDTSPNRLLWAEIDVPTSPEVTEAFIIKGAEVYQNACAACHGDTGRGNGSAAVALKTPPRDFSLGLFKLRSTTGFPTDSDLYRSITVGFPEYGMPSTEAIPPEDRWALVHHVKHLIHAAAPDTSLEPGTPITIPAPKKYSRQSIELGKTYYNRMACAYCHGDNGDLGSTVPLLDAQGNTIYPRNFLDGPTAFKAGGRPEDIARILVTGMTGTPMQPYTSIGTNNEYLWDVANYVYYLSTLPQEDTP